MADRASVELLLVACELAVRVDSRPARRDGSDAAVYASSGRTLALRIQAAGASFVTTCNQVPLDGDGHPAPFRWNVSLQVGAARQTNYTVWLRESPEQIGALCRARREARALRDSLPHGERKKKPWGPL